MIIKKNALETVKSHKALLVAAEGPSAFQYMKPTDLTLNI